MLIDTHCHLNFKAYKDDADEVIKRTLKNDTWMINVGSLYSTSFKAIELAQNYKEGVYAAIALHPIHIKGKNIIDLSSRPDLSAQADKSEINNKSNNLEEFDYQKYLTLAKNKKVVAIGETGLDYYRIKNENEKEIKALQRKVFIEHIELAKELKKPLIIHCREAHPDLYKILSENFKNKKISDFGNGVLHCFSGTYEDAREYINLGFLISFTGIITFTNQYDDIIKKLPMDKIMVETDSPYLTPVPFRGKRNEPLYVKYIAQRIAEIKGIDFEKVAEETTNNAKNLFKI